MKIIADENMPNAQTLFSHLGEVTLVNGRTLTNAQVKEVDVLLVRSVTKVAKVLLENSTVRFVGSATIGVDHIDEGYLAEANIAFSSAPGCNAQAVADYVFSGLSYLYLAKGLTWLSKKIAIIGYGSVGETVYRRFVQLGCDVCVYDPYKQDLVGGVNFVSLDEVLSCDIISLHAPLTKQGAHPTQGMLGEAELSRLPVGVTIISAGRGGVIDEDALIHLYRKRHGVMNLIIDVWEGEPNINQALVDLVDIATPHIAGYSKQGREKGSWMVYQSLCAFLGLDESLMVKEGAISAGWVSTMTLDPQSSINEEVLARSIHAIYDVARDDARLRFKYRQNTEVNVFDWLRRHYVERDEFNTCFVKSGADAHLSLMQAAGFSI